jgi:hypothetical protein
MLSPLLIIGVGGAGGKTIRAMKQELNRILESSGYTDGIPAAWQFLQIDTTYDGVDFPAPMLPQDEFHCVVPRGSNYSDLLASITARGSLHEQQGMLSGWAFPDPLISINQSPSLVRAIGRVTIMADAGKTLQAIQASISKMKAPTALSELAEVAKKLGAKAPYFTPQAFIVSSLGGGSGSGMFTDVAELLKRATQDAWVGNAISFLYTPDVFASIGQVANTIPKNTLGAMNELIASQWVEISQQSELLYSKMGLTTGNNSGKRNYGCRDNILIGARSKNGTNISYGAESAGMNEVFLNIGEALAGAISNDAISDFILEHFLFRARHNLWQSDSSGLTPGINNVDNLVSNVSGIGFGKLSVGAKHLIDYVADALTKSQVEVLLWPELSPSLLKSGKSLQDLIQAKSDQAWPTFLLSSRLDERGSQNQIIDALLPDQLNDRIKQHVVGIIKKNISSSPRPLATFSKAVWSDWETDSYKFLRTLESEMSSKAQRWVPEIQSHVQELIVRELTSNGYAITTSLVERLKIELKEHVIPELNREHTEFAKAISTFDQRFFNTHINEIANGLTGVSAQNGPFFEKLSSSLNRLVEFQINSHVTNLASSLVDDMLNFLLEPLIVQISDAKFTLHTSIKSSTMPNGAINSFPSFPDWGSGVVPNRYRSRPLERALIEPSDYELIYDFYAGNDTQGGPPFQMSIDAALLGKTMNPTPGDPNPQTLITATSPWVTSVRDAQDATGAAVNKAVWKFNTDIEELSTRNRRWLTSSESSFARFTKVSIREFVTAIGGSPQVREAREAKFVREYEAMLGIAQPLTLLNPNAIRDIFSSNNSGWPDGVSLKSSKIPFDINSNVGRACATVLQQYGLNPSQGGISQTWFDPSDNHGEMFAVSTLENNLPAWAFASLTDPILDQVAQSKIHINTWEQFWDGRRARPLTEAVPFETEMRRSIITGWFIATLFGMRKVWPLPEGRTVQIWNPTLETPDWSSFPSPLLATHHEDSRHESWVLPQLLMSAGIALANFGKSGNPEFINGYRLLKFLGREVTTSFRNRDDWDGSGSGDLLPTGERSKSNYLKSWVESGESPYQNGALVTPLQVSLALTPDRAEALIKTVQLMRSEYSAIWMKFSESPWRSLPETWELKEDIDCALEDISNYVSRLRP